MIRSVTRRLITAVLLLLAFVAPRAIQAQEQMPPAAHVVAFGLYGQQDLFKREATAAAKVLSRQFNESGHIIIRANDSKGSDALIGDLAEALRDVAQGMDRERDVLVLFLTTHGTKKGLVVLRRGDKRFWHLTPALLKQMLDETGIRHRAVILSACYAGVFAKALVDERTLLITAADAEHTSFGCSDDNKGDYTYFGEAFFGQSLRPGVPIDVAFRSAYQRIARREAAERLIGSNPQMLGGKLVLEQLGRVR